MEFKIRFLYCGEAGYWHSVEGRFKISPGGFRHGVTPDFYELQDAVTKKSTNHDTIGEAKQEATNISYKDAKFECAV